MRIIFSSSNGDDLKFVQSLSESLKSDLISEPRLATALTGAQHSLDAATIFVGVENSFQIKQYRDLFRALDPGLVHFIINSSDYDSLKFAFTSGFSDNIIFRRYDEPIEDGRHYSRIMDRYKSEVRPGLNHLLPNAHVRTLNLKDAGQKDFVADSVFFQLQSLECSERVAHTVANAVDELILNAIFKVTTGKDLRAKSSGDESSKGHSVQMQLGSSGNYIAIAVIDKQGLLNQSIAFRHLANTFEGKANTEVRDGLGLSLILRSGISLRFLCSPGKYTEVSLLFKKTQRLLDFKSQFQFVSFSSAS